jgi:hypothetical protein
LKEKMDEELVLRLQHLHNIMKMTAPCWTKSIYRYPQLVNQTWTYWKNLKNNLLIKDNFPTLLPENWKKHPEIGDNIIKACPFRSLPQKNNNKKGNVKHLHLYCTSSFLQRAKTHYNQKIEAAIHKL